MLVLALVAGGIILYAKLKHVDYLNKGMLPVLLLLPAFIAYSVAVAVVPNPGDYSKIHADLIQRQAFIEELPEIQTVNGKIKPSDITIAENIMQKKNQFKKDVENYNNTIKFWKHHPYMDILLWGFPRWGYQLSKMPLIKVNF
jgi:hypothetical protein